MFFILVPFPDKCVKDIIVLLDTSVSIGPSNFENKIKPFLKQLESDPDLNVSPQGTHIAIVAFSTPLQTKILLSFDEGYGAMYRDTVNNFRWERIKGGNTRTDLGFQKAGEVCNHVRALQE